MIRSNRDYPKRRTAMILASLLCIAVSFLLFVPSCSTLNNNTNLTHPLNDLLSEFNSITAKNKELTQPSNRLMQQDTSLAQQNRYFSPQNVSLLQDNANYKADRTQLLSAFTEYNSRLQNELVGAIAPPYITMSNRQATYAFHNLDGQIESWSFDAEALEASIVYGTLMRKLEIEDLNKLGAGIIAQRFNNGNKYINFDGKYNVLDLRPYIQEENFQSLAYSFYSRYTDDASRIKEVWNTVVQLCPYTNEQAETPRLPLETLLFGGGDCKDLSILTASILKEMSPNWNVEFVYMDLDNPSSPQTLNHVTVFVDTGNYKTFVESTGNFRISPYESVRGYYMPVP